MFSATWEELVFMKRFIAVAALVLAVIIAQAVPAEAREVYAASETRNGKTSDYYVITESFVYTDYGFKVGLHSVGRNFSENKYWELGFTKQSDGLYAILLPSSYTTQVMRGTEYVVNQRFFDIFITAIKNHEE